MVGWRLVGWRMVVVVQWQCASSWVMAGAGRCEFICCHTNRFVLAAVHCHDGELGSHTRGWRMVGTSAVCRIWGMAGVSRGVCSCCCRGRFVLELSIMAKSQGGPIACMVGCQDVSGQLSSRSSINKTSSAPRLWEVVETSIYTHVVKYCVTPLAVCCCMHAPQVAASERVLDVWLQLATELGADQAQLAAVRVAAPTGGIPVGASA